jgi:hypothetical protein
LQQYGFAGICFFVAACPVFGQSSGAPGSLSPGSTFGSSSFATGSSATPYSQAQGAFNPNTLGFSGGSLTGGFSTGNLTGNATGGSPGTGNQTGLGIGMIYNVPLPPASTYVSQMNPFGIYSANPLVFGAPRTLRNTGFGIAVANTTGSFSGFGYLGGFSGGFPGSYGMAGSPYGSSYGSGYPGSTGGMSSPRYVVSVEFAHPTITSGKLLEEVRTLLGRTQSLSQDTKIQAVLDGGILVLRGIAADDHDRRLAESIVRLTPGVHDVVNQIRLPEPAPPPAPKKSE